MSQRPSTTTVRQALLGVVRRAHASSGLSCRELASRAGLSHPTVLRVLRGRGFSLDVLEALMVALGVQDDVVRVLYAARTAEGVVLVDVVEVGERG